MVTPYGAHPEGSQSPVRVRISHTWLASRGHTQGADGEDGFRGQELAPPKPGALPVAAGLLLRAPSLPSEESRPGLRALRGLAGPSFLPSFRGAGAAPAPCPVFGEQEEARW